MNDFLQYLKFDFSELLNSIKDFFETYSNDVMNDEMIGLILYLYGCIPLFMRNFMLVCIFFAVILALKEIFAKK